ncbi:hypothetical protein SBA5_830001 [Candidatus Sulfotelmatomonas gaucii]|uniref:Uncharacterized protein n=1 Tax=Candidatus Sulfuritelmatomonas gaucii TaxID=2043161 RepID=A0A2N9M6N0_9BACT|nr:hypothetical protein SBA5_830001 [Candidatus Sulfotelmatomonas gaucii]
MNVEQVDSKADSTATRKTRLTQYRKNAERWQFFAVARNEDGKPNPDKIIIAGRQVDWQTPGAKFYLNCRRRASCRLSRSLEGEPAQVVPLSCLTENPRARVGGEAAGFTMSFTERRVRRWMSVESIALRPCGGRYFTYWQIRWLCLSSGSKGRLGNL